MQPSDSFHWNGLLWSNNFCPWGGIWWCVCKMCMWKSSELCVLFEMVMTTEHPRREHAIRTPLTNCGWITTSGRKVQKVSSTCHVSTCKEAWHWRCNSNLQPEVSFVVVIWSPLGFPAQPEPPRLCKRRSSGTRIVWSVLSFPEWTWTACAPGVFFRVHVAGMEMIQYQ